MRNGSLYNGDRSPYFVGRAGIIAEARLEVPSKPSGEEGPVIGHERGCRREEILDDFTERELVFRCPGCGGYVLEQVGW